MKTPQGFDYIIVGAGSAGCVVASRLSQNPDIRVALVEAGGPDDAPEIHMPVAFPQLFKTKYDWDFASEPEPGLANRRIYLPRGKTLGGSSAINAMIYIRGNAADLDGWADDGAPGWSYREMLPYFIRSEWNERGDPRYHGHSGPLAVQDGRSMHPLVDHLLEAGSRLGYRSNDDFNGASQMGLGRFQPHATKWSSVQCRLRLSPPCARTGEPARFYRQPRSAVATARTPRYRCVNTSSWQGGNPIYRKGNDPRGRLLWLTPNSDALRYWAGRGPGPVRHSCGR